jgi:hypothetical protein
MPPFLRNLEKKILKNQKQIRQPLFNFETNSLLVFMANYLI